MIRFATFIFPHTDCTCITGKIKLTKTQHTTNFAISRTRKIVQFFVKSPMSLNDLNFSQIANKKRMNNLSSDNAMLAHDLFLFGWGRPDICCVSVLHSWPCFSAFCSVLMTSVLNTGQFLIKGIRDNNSDD